MWLSIDNSWFKWCIENDFSTCDLESCNIYEAEINLEEMCVINSFDKLKEFSEKYANKNHDYINLTKVSQDYDGIMFINYEAITNYINKNCNYDKYCWYCLVDVNSVCIWNRQSLKSFRNFLFIQIKKRCNIFICIFF